ncbi:PREDICTED: zinc finger CCCH domain-containing protein 3 isoform X2 [Acromyrmex echinatior]|uniref:Zinc finger CCCH domain-containing protein 3 n=1 Tax=Acromyrmex echinatior TaxID=103372 RepID=F4WKG0_ACREC|nr:PREDICTED: zinc finger CCCH domain-containing protein 3 isoform X2 [Acromyrmex echinatior]EGI65298.1 Zinc finger CCCH domain-containing protein 3 [Acromyrmex echinatior]
MGVPSSASTEVNILNEIYFLKSQIEQYKQKTQILQSNEKTNYSNRKFKFVKPKVQSDLVCHSSLNSKMLPETSTKNVHVNSTLLTTNVYVNPNFKPQKSTVHINPNIHAKPLIHINPKVMHDISNKKLQNNISATNASITKTNNSTGQANVKRSIYVNPTLLKKLSSKEKSTNSKESVATERSVCSRLKFIKNIDNRKISPKKTSNSSIILLSRRKLVRVSTTKNTSKISPLHQRRLLKHAELKDKKLGTTQKSIKMKPLISNTLSTSTVLNLSKSNIDKSKVTKYKIDRTALHVSKAKEIGLSETTKVINDTKKLVTIGGIVYRASKNKLIRRNSLLKRKRSISGKNDKFVSFNKKQRMSKESLNRTSEVDISSKSKFAFNVSSKTYKNSISNKAKQRSIRILRNKMHKNNQPCLIYQRFGSCPNYENGTCPKRHDKNQVSLCKNFLQGKCFLNKCSLSHDVGPEKMPTCKYFLDGCCTRDACPYLHVKVSSNTSICIDFLQGYCAKGNKCQRRHEYLCPEFNKSGNCSKGECCPYPHKSHSFNSEKNTKYLNKTHDTQKYHATLATDGNSENSNSEGRLRYYELTGLSEEPKKKKEIQIDDSIKQIKTNEIKENESLFKENKRELGITVYDHNVKKKISIGGYIPIDHL